MPPSALEIFKSNIPNVENVVFLIGAGLSLESGFPLWRDAASEALRLAEERGMASEAVSYGRLLLSKYDYYGLFDLLKKNLNPTLYRVVALEVFGGESRSSPTQVELLQIQARGIITTNFDECLAAAAVHSHGYTPLSKIAEILATDRYFVAKPHGSLDDFASMVLTTEDWQSVVSRGDLRRLLAHVIGQYQLVIIGYSMNDPDFNHIWADILNEYLPRETALYCARQGDLSTERIVELNNKHIHVIEFVDSAGDFSFVKEIISSLKPAIGSVRPASVSSVNIQKRVDDLERYVMLCLEFSTTSSPRLELMCRAIILEKLSSSANAVDPITLVEHVCKVLATASAQIQAATTSAMTQLIANRSIIKDANSRLLLSEAYRKTLEERVRALGKEELAALDSLRVSFASRHTVQLELNHLKHIVDMVVSALGQEVAEFLLYNTQALVSSDSIASVVGSYCKEHNIPATLHNSYLAAVKQFILEPKDTYAEVLFSKLQSYFITTAYILDANSTRLMADYARGHIVYLDSSIVLPAMATGHSSQLLYQGMLAATRRLGIHLKISREMLNEVSSNIQTAMRSLRMFAKSGASMRDILAGYFELQPKGTGNVFLEGYCSELERDASSQWPKYMQMIMGGSSLSTEEATRKVLWERFEIELDSAKESDLDGEELRRLTDEVAYLRKAGNRYKSDLLCRHEAVQFALLHKRRAEDALDSPRIWFVTTDYFFTELQRLEKTRYPLPVSYTPRMWMQYLNLLDYESRGNSNFAKLQQRMRYGVASGGMALTAIHTILSEKKEMIGKGVVSVKELAQAIVKDYHVKSAIENYELTNDKQSGKETVARNIRAAIDKVTIVKAEEWERLAKERDSAIADATAAKKELSQKKYGQKINLRPPRKKGRGRR